MRWLLIFALLIPSCLLGATTATVTTPGTGATVSGTTITTLLAYANPTSCVNNSNTVCYVGSTITITGSLCSSGSPCTWTLADQNGDVVNTVSTTAQVGTANVLGQINCTGSAANTVCLYLAPQEYPSTQVVTITITDGSTSATVTVNFNYLDQVNEFWTHRGRFLSYQIPYYNIPWSIYSQGGTPAIYQPLQTNFIDTSVSPYAGQNPGPIEMAIVTFSSDPGGVSGVLMPITDGSSINRPSFSYNGEWLIYDDYTPFVNSSNNTEIHWVQHTDGSQMQSLSTTCIPSSSGTMPEKNQPNWLISTTNTNLTICNLAASQTATNIAAHGLNVAGGYPLCSTECPGSNSYEGGANDSRFMLSTGNPQYPSTLTITGTGLSGGNTCTYTYSGATNSGPFVGVDITVAGTTNGGGACNVTNQPIVTITGQTSPTSGGTFTIAVSGTNFSSASDSGTGTIAGCYPIQTACSSWFETYDLSNCYSSLTANCATLQGSAWSSFLNILPADSYYGYDASGNGHCTTIDTETTPPPPNCEWHLHDWWYFPRSNNVAFLYGPRGSTGEAMFFQVGDTGSGILNVSPNTVTNINDWGHPAANHSNPYLITYGGAINCNASGPQTTPHTCTQSTSGNVVTDLRTGIYSWFSGVTVGHSCWDGYYIGFFCHDSTVDEGLTEIINGCTNERLSEENYGTYASQGSATRIVVQAFGCRPSTGSGFANGFLLSPSQSPDATKLTYSMYDSMQANVEAIYIGWLFNTHKGLPPINVKLASSSSALIKWFAAPLNRETKAYWIYKQASCTGSWSRLASVSAVYLQATAYTYTDSALSSGTNACYGITSQEWFGDESDHLSNVIKIANASGTFTQTVEQGEGTIGFAPSGPSNVSSMAVAAKTVCASKCAAVNTPSAPTLFTTTGSMTGEYWVGVSYCKYLDFPKNTNPVCTPLGNLTASATLSAQGLNVKSSEAEMVGQDAIQVYMFGPSSTAPSPSAMFLQTPSNCGAAPTITPNGAGGGAIFCQFTTYTGSGSAPPTSNTTLGGYSLTWTDAGGAGDRYDQIYYREGGAVILSGSNGCDGVALGATIPAIGSGNPGIICTTELAAQSQLIATPPVGTQSFYDAFPNQGVSAANIHYAIVVKKMDGTRSAGVCMTGAGVSESCN
jgi:hypothetical protein